MSPCLNYVNMTNMNLYGILAIVSNWIQLLETSFFNFASLVSFFVKKIVLLTSHIHIHISIYTVGLKYSGFCRLELTFQSDISDLVYHRLVPQ